MKQYFYAPWEQVLLDRVSKAKSSIDLIAPFIKTSTLKKILLVLPIDRAISLRMLTRFSTQVFSQKSSDLSAIDLFLGYASKYHKVSAFRLNRLHAKIYIIDDQEMFITSSNLSYSGLIANVEIAVHVKESADVMEVRAVLDRYMQPETQISLPEITEMARAVQMEIRTLTTEGVTQELEHREEMPLESDSQALIEQDDEEYAPVEEDPTGAAKRLGTLTEINEYISKRGVAALNQIDGEVFESVHRGTPPATEASESERAKFIEEWSSKANRDVGRIEAHLRSLFGKYLPVESGQWNQFALIFTHASWLNACQHEEFLTQKVLHFRYGQLGADLRDFLIARRLTTGRFFAESSFGWYAINKTYIASTYPCERALSSLGCRFFLHLGDLMDDVDSVLFNRLLGFLFTNLTDKAFQSIFQRHLDFVEEYEYDDYSDFDSKTSLQEVLQAEDRTPRRQARYEHQEPTGPEHKKVFHCRVFAGNTYLGQGVGKSKKEGEKAAATEALLVIGQKSGYLQKPRISEWRKVRKYSISEDRYGEMEQLGQKLFAEWNNPRLLDIALTHSSILLAEPHRRSYRRLAFLGALAGQVIRNLAAREFIETHPELSEREEQFLKRVHNVPQERACAAWFDEHDLDCHLSRVGPFKSIPVSLKVDVVQALIAAVCLEYGFGAAKNAFHGVWSKLIGTVSIEESDLLDWDYVSRLQDMVQVKYRTGTSRLSYSIVSDKTLADNTYVCVVACMLNGSEIGRGTGTNKKKAMQKAAEAALKSGLLNTDGT
jgi:ribonuclease-3